LSQKSPPPVLVRKMGESYPYDGKLTLFGESIRFLGKLTFFGESLRFLVKINPFW